MTYTFPSESTATPMGLDNGFGSPMIFQTNSKGSEGIVGEGAVVGDGVGGGVAGAATGVDVAVGG